jgi:hypothetical protein
MELSEGIRKHGFRKWYERELMHSHAHLLLLIGCAVGLMSSLALYSQTAPWSERVMDAAAIALLGTVGYWSLRRFFYLLLHAEHVANQAVCTVCKTYGRLTLPEGRRPREHALLVRCRKCEHEWTIVD